MLIIYRWSLICIRSSHICQGSKYLLCLHICMWWFNSYHRPATPEGSAALERCFWWPCWSPRMCSCPHPTGPPWQCRGCLSSERRSAWCPGWQTTGTRWRSTWRWALSKHITAFMNRLSTWTDHERSSSRLITPVWEAFRGKVLEPTLHN